MPKMDEKKIKLMVEREEEMRTSLKSNVKFTADHEKLKRLCSVRGISYSQLSKKLGHDPGWLSQRTRASKNLPEFAMFEADAAKIADVLICRTDDFAAACEHFTTPVVLDINAEYKDFLENLPADRYNILRSFMKFMREADTSDLVNIQNFFRQPHAPTNKRWFSDQKAEKSWLYTYILTHTRDLFYEELSNSLMASDNNSLQEAVSAITGRAKKKRANLSKEDARKYNVSKEIRDKLRSNLKSATEDDFDIAFRDAKNRLYDACVQILLKYYYISTQDATLIVNDLKAITESHRKY